MYGCLQINIQCKCRGIISCQCVAVHTHRSKHSLWIPHLLIHPRHPQSDTQLKPQITVVKLKYIIITHIFIFYNYHKTLKNSGSETWTSLTHRVTMSALAVSTAIASGSCPLSSTAYWLAPLFRSRHTCLQQPMKIINIYWCVCTRCHQINSS